MLIDNQNSVLTSYIHRKIFVILTRPWVYFIKTIKREFCLVYTFQVIRINKKKLNKLSFTHQLFFSYKMFIETNCALRFTLKNLFFLSFATIKTTKVDSPKQNNYESKLFVVVCPQPSQAWKFEHKKLPRPNMAWLARGVGNTCA